MEKEEAREVWTAARSRFDKIPMRVQESFEEWWSERQKVKSVDLADVVGQSEQSCKHPDSCAMGYYHQIDKYYCSKCEKTGLQD